MKKIISIFIIFLNFSSAFGQLTSKLNQGSIKQKKYFHTAKYEKIKEKLIVKASINSKNYRFLLDTGAPFCISKKLFDELKLTRKGIFTISNTSEKKENLVTISLPKMQLGEITFLNSEGLVLPESATDLLECLKIDGIIGSNILRNSIIQFDDKNQLITITNNSKNLNLENIPYQKMKLSAIQSDPLIYLVLQKGNEKLGDEVLFDTGSDSFYSMSYEASKFFQNKSDVIELLSETYGSYSIGVFGFDNNQNQSALNVPSILINNTKFEDVKVFTKSGKTSTIGSTLLQFGKVTLDYQNKRFYLQPYADNNKSDELKKIPWGISTILSENKLIVGIIWDKTLLGKINIGDQILKIDDLNFENIKFCDLLNSKIGNRVSTVKLIDVKTKEIKYVEIKPL